MLVLVLVLVSLVLVTSLPITFDVVFNTLSSYRWRCDTIAMLTLDDTIRYDTIVCV